MGLVISRGCGFCGAHTPVAWGKTLARGLHRGRAHIPLANSMPSAGACNPRANIDDPGGIPGPVVPGTLLLVGAFLARMLKNSNALCVIYCPYIATESSSTLCGIFRVTSIFTRLLRVAVCIVKSTNGLNGGIR